MGWGDVLAGIGGAAAGADNAMRFYSNQDRQRESAQLRMMLQQILEEGRNERANAALGVREKALNDTKAAKDADRAQRASDTAARLDHMWADYGMKYDLGQQRIDTENRGIDERGDQFWNGTNALGWASDATRRYVSDQGNATSRANAALASDTSQRNTDVNAAVSQRNTDVNDTRARFGITARSLQNFMADPANQPTAPPAPAQVQPPARVAPPVPVGRGRTPAAAGKSGAKTVSMSELQQIATMRGTSVEEQQRRAEAEGYSVVR
jgi:hypothetical protein